LGCFYTIKRNRYKIKTQKILQSDANQLTKNTVIASTKCSLRMLFCDGHMTMLHM